MNDHAERLRKMAAGRLQSARDEEQLNAGLNLHSGAMIATKQSIAHYRAQAAALLAGAEALDAVEVAKAALLKVRDHARPTHREDAYEVCYDWCPLCAVTAALARLEGK